MIAKILGSSSSFPAVEYNSSKIDNEKGELLDVVNIPHSRLDILEPDDIRMYLENISAHKKKRDDFKNIQFHATLSCKGKEFDKIDLKNISHKWMDAMGYKNQPYAIIFHNDTGNNHVHIVSTKVDISSGLKISDSNNHYKARNSINKIMREDYGQDTKFKSENKISNFVRSYSFDSYNSLKTFLNSENQKVFLDKDDKNILNVYNNDWKGNFKLDDLKTQYVLSSDDKKKYQALLYKYNEKLDSNLYGYSNKDMKYFYKYNSDFTKELKDKLGIELKPVIRDGKVSNYTLIDHNKKLVLNGNSIMNSRVLFKGAIKPLNHSLINNINRLNINSPDKLDAISKIYNVPKFALEMNFNSDSKVMKSYQDYFKNNPDTTLDGFSKTTGSTIHNVNGETYILNSENGFFENTKDVLPKKDKINIGADYQPSYEDDLGFNEAKSVIHNISNALRTGEEGGNNDQRKYKKKRKKR